MPEQQLVEIARALGAEARILIMDEPTASLSDKEVERLFRVIRELKAHGVGIIYISHRLEELPQIADRVTALRDGVLVGTRPMAEVTRGRADPDDGRPRAVGRLSQDESSSRARSCSKFAAWAAGRRASTTSTCSVRAGEILGLAGLVGAGRTELARRSLRPDAGRPGEILLRGRPVAIDSPAQAVALGIAYVPEDRRRHGVILEMSSAANTTLATLAAIVTVRPARLSAASAPIAARFRPPARDQDRLARDARWATSRAATSRKWRWRAGWRPSPSVLILDEPTQGVDVGAKAEIHRLMSELAGRGLAILMISSELPEILGMSDRIAVMHGGTIAGDARPRGGDPGGDPRAGAGPRRAAARRKRGGLMIGRYRRELSVAAAYALLLLVLAVAAPRFFRPDQLRAFVVSNASVLVAAVGMTLVILCRQIDISIGSQFSICGVVAGLLARAGLPIPLVALGTLAGRRRHGRDQRRPGRRVWACRRSW